MSVPDVLLNITCGFNPAEAEEGFSRRISILFIYLIFRVSIQPKPKKGLVAKAMNAFFKQVTGFNPAEAEEGFSRSLSHKERL